MGLFFYKKFSIQTKYTPEGIKQRFSEKINNPLTWKYAGVNKILTDDWVIRTDFTSNGFQTALTLKLITKIPFLLRREGIRTVLKGKIRQNKNIEGAIISMIVRPTDEYIYILCFLFSALIAALFYAILKNNTELLIISSILVFVSYIGFLIDFNSQVRVYKKIIDTCVN
jgi:hypothetical protein